MKSIKEVVITLPDGPEVKLGMSVYVTHKKEVSSYDNAKAIKSYSGIRSGEIVPHKVIGINTGTNVRSFTLKSDKGCEITHSVRNQCLGPNIFGKKANALKRVKEYTNEDISHLTRKINFYQLKINLYKKTINKLK